MWHINLPAALGNLYLREALLTFAGAAKLMFPCVRAEENNCFLRRVYKPVTRPGSCFRLSGLFKLRNPPFIRTPLVCPEKFSAEGRKIFGFWNLLKRPKMSVLAIFSPPQGGILGIWDFHKKPPCLSRIWNKGGFLTWIALIYMLRWVYPLLNNVYTLTLPHFREVIFNVS